MKLFFSLFLFCIFLSFSVFANSSSSLPETQKDYLLALQNKAKELKLSEKAQWLTLLHYHKRVFSQESTIDSQSFFLSSEGKENPETELQATIKAFFTPLKDIPKNKEKSEHFNHAQCVFPARFQWLKEELQIKEEKLPSPNCIDYTNFKKTLNTERLALIFTSAYMSNPASFFGHTLLRLDGTSQNALLSHAVNYGALTQGDGGVAFIFKGVFGGYNGIFSVYPYYETVNLYNNMENRDIWEYQLNIPPEKIDFFVAHVWELGQNSAQYYFFSENCSYMLLETLNVLFPETDFTKEFYHTFFSNYTIPVETIRTLLKQENILKEAIYRPSRKTKIDYAYQNLSNEQKKELRKLLKKPRDVKSVQASVLSNEEKSAVFITAYEYLQYQLIKEKISVDELRTESMKILTALNGIKEKTTLPKVPTPSKSPEKGHLPGATGVFIGQKNHNDFVEFSLRPAYHSLLDETTGFIPFGAISYLKTTLRWYENENDLVLQKFDFLDITSFNPRNELFNPLSFKVNVGVERYRFPTKEEEGTVFNTTLGIGLTKELKKGIAVYVMANSYLKAGGYLDHNSMGQIAGELGVIADLKNVRLKGEIEKIYSSQPDANLWKYGLSGSLSLTNNIALEASFLFEDGRTDNHEGRLGFLFYF